MAKNKKNNKWLFLTILIVIVVVAILVLVFSQTSKTGEAILSTKSLNKNGSGSLQDDITFDQQAIRYSFLNYGIEKYGIYQILHIQTDNPYYKYKHVNAYIGPDIGIVSASSSSSLAPIGDNTYYFINLFKENQIDAHTDYLSFRGNAEVLVNPGQGSEDYSLENIYNQERFGFNKIENINPSCKGAEITFKGLDDVNGSWKPTYIYFSLNDKTGNQIAYADVFNKLDFEANGDYHTFFEEYSKEIIKHLSTGREYTLTVVVQIYTAHNNLSMGHYETKINCTDGISNLNPINKKTLTDEEMVDIIKKYPYKEK